MPSDPSTTHPIFVSVEVALARPGGPREPPGRDSAHHDGLGDAFARGRVYPSRFSNESNPPEGQRSAGHEWARAVAAQDKSARFYPSASERIE
jgi:hypothetical protein